MIKVVFIGAMLILASMIVFSFISKDQTMVGKDEGKELFVKYCASCHGETGKGDGPLGARLNPKPTDLTDKTLHFAHDDAYHFKVIKEGGAAVGKSQIMPPWGSTLKDDQIKDTIAYIKSLLK